MVPEVLRCSSREYSARLTTSFTDLFAHYANYKKSSRGFITAFIWVKTRHIKMSITAEIKQIDLQLFRSLITACFGDRDDSGELET